MMKTVFNPAGKSSYFR